MSNDFYQFNFEHDQQPTENQYPINDVQWIYINDINQLNYSNGYINFTNISVIGIALRSSFFLAKGTLRSRIQLLSHQLVGLILSSMMQTLMLFQLNHMQQ